MWIATVITAHGLTLFASWIQLRWQVQQEHAHRQDLIAMVCALPDGGRIHEDHSDGSWTRLVVTRAGYGDRSHG
jgi:hypothetical protein